MHGRPPISPELQAAQELLYQKRAEARAERIRRGLPVDLHQHVQPCAATDATAEDPSVDQLLAQLPLHLGWGSAAGTQAVRQALARRGTSAEDDGEASSRPWAELLKQLHGKRTEGQDDSGQGKKTTRPKEDAAEATVKVYPALAIAMLKEGYAPQARVYYLLRHLDQVGRGWLDVDEIREQLTGKDAELRIANKKVNPTNAWRSLRGILNKGEGIFWNRDDVGRLWLQGAAKIAATLNCDRITGYPVHLPITRLLGGIKEVRASLYATFHTGREKDPTKKGIVHRPISQATVREVTGIPEATQRRYNKVAKVRAYKHYATGRKFDRERFKDSLYERWGNAFKFTDYNGKHGPAQAAYIGHRLPNSYTTKTLQASKGRQAKINKHIDLVTNVGEEGAQRERLANNQPSTASSDQLGATSCASSSLTQPARGNGADVDRLFYSDGKQAYKAHQKRTKHDHFYQSQVGIRGNGRIWYVHQREQH